jgi:ABC-type transport system involved in multi-copper enzyme maturation permease subunit
MAISSLAGYLSLGFTHPLYLTLCVAAIVGFAARSLAGEMERGTVQLALARPVSRGQLYLSRTIGVVAISVALAIVGPLGLVVGYRLAEPSASSPFGHLLPLAVANLALFLAIGGLALLGSATANSAGRVLGWGLAIFVLMYFVDYFAGIWNVLKPIEFLSLFDYYDPTTALVIGTVAAGDLLVLGLTGLAGYAAACSSRQPRLADLSDQSRSLLFDLNRTLLDVSALDPLFAEAFGDAAARRYCLDNPSG